MEKTVLVIGNGIAALSAVERMRALDQKNKIIIFSKEPYHTYNRLELSKRIAKKYSVQEILVKPEQWYQENKVECHLTWPITKLDFEQKKVFAENGQAFSYTHLLLANGGSNFVPPLPGIDLPNVFSLRTLNDAKRIAKVVSPGKHLLIIGGGLLSLELAWQFCQIGLKVTIVELFPQLMPRQLDLVSAQYLQEVIAGHGVELILNGQIERLEGEKSLTGFQIKGETNFREADFCIYCTGMRPNIGLFEGTTLQLKRGIVVNEKMSTNLENVYAAGDIAEYNGLVYGLWSAAKEQGAVAGENIAGGFRVFTTSSPLTNINVFHQMVTSIGEVQQNEVFVFEKTGFAEAVFKKLFFKGDVLCGGIFVNDQKEILTVRKAIAAAVSVPKGLRGSYQEVINHLRNKLGFG